MARIWTCPKCRALVEPGTRSCPYCGTDLRAQAAPDPVRDAGRTLRAVAWLLGINLAFFALTIVLDPARGDQDGLSLEPSLQAMWYFGAVEVDAVRRCGQLWRLLAAVFLHFDLLHLLFNSVALFVVAPLAAHTFGLSRTVGLYVLGGLGASTASVLYLGPGGVSAGASGALCALIAAVAVYGRRRGGVVGDLLWRRMLGWGLFIVAFGFIVPGIDNAGHIGGFAGGALLGWIAARPYARGGREDRAWRYLSYGCLALVGAVIAGGMVPSVLRGLRSGDVIYYRSESELTLRQMEQVLAGELPAKRLPRSLGAPPPGAGALHAALGRALEAGRAEGGPRPEARALLRKAREAWRDWLAGLDCLYARVQGGRG